MLEYSTKSNAKECRNWNTSKRLLENEMAKSKNNTPVTHMLPKALLYVTAKSSNFSMPYHYWYHSILSNKIKSIPLCATLFSFPFRRRSSRSSSILNESHTKIPKISILSYLFDFIGESGATGMIPSII
jgi:hypothetical protein